jgi:hypothetical protein
MMEAFTTKMTELSGAPTKTLMLLLKFLEATPGIEPECTDLQSGFDESTCWELPVPTEERNLTRTMISARPLGAEAGR